MHWNRCYYVDSTYSALDCMYFGMPHKSSVCAYATFGKVISKQRVNVYIYIYVYMQCNSVLMSGRTIQWHAIFVLICQIHSFVTPHSVNTFDRMFSQWQSGMRAYIIYICLFLPCTFYLPTVLISFMHQLLTIDTLLLYTHKIPNSIRN